MFQLIKEIPATYQVVVTHAFNPSTHMDLCELEANLVYRPTSRTAKAIQTSPVLKEKGKKYLFEKPDN